MGRFAGFSITALHLHWKIGHTTARARMACTLWINSLSSWWLDECLFTCERSCSPGSLDILHPWLGAVARSPPDDTDS